MHLLVRLIGALLVYAFGQVATATEVPSYAIGNIPNLINANGSRVTFAISVPSATGPTFLMHVAHPPAGRISIDASSGVFDYIPDQKDKFNFVVYFDVKYMDSNNATIEKTQAVQFSPRVVPSEERLINEGTVVIPNTESPNYIVASVSNNPARPVFNTISNRITRNIEISGKTVVLQQGHPNNISRFFADTHSGSSGNTANSDIENFAIYAETVIVRDHVWLPETTVTIFAKEVRFEDQARSPEKASLDTTPLAFTIKPAQFQSGVAGHAAGNLMLHVSLLTLNGPAKRFILHGGGGQPGGDGKPGDPGSSMPSITVPVLLSRQPLTNVVFYDLPWFQHVAFGTKAWPGDGHPATPGGKSGDGGHGGSINAYCQCLASMLADAADLAGGGPGAKAADQPGGPPGQPQHAVWASNRSSTHNAWPARVTASHDAQPGPGATSPTGAVGPTGNVQVHDSRLAIHHWLHHTALRAMLDYAEDTYRGGGIDDAQKQISDISSFASDLGDRTPSETVAFNIMTLEIAALLQKLQSHLDFYGNPGGWVPMLSLTADLRVYRTDIDNAIKTEYLAYVTLRAFQKGTSTLSSLRAAVASQEEDVTHARDSYNMMQDQIPGLQGQLAVIQRDSAELQSEIQLRLDQLARVAANNVEQRHADAGLFSGLKTLGAICKVIPVYQPMLAAVGTGIDALNKLSSDPTGAISTLASVPSAFSQTNISEAKAKLDNQIKSLDIHNTDHIGQYLKDLANTGKEWGATVHTFQTLIQGTSAPKDEIDAELQRLKAQDSTLVDLVNKIDKLNGEKMAFTNALNQMVQQASAALTQISADVSSIDSMNAQATNLSGKLDHDVVVQVTEMQRRARERRLKYEYYLKKAYEYELLAAYPGPNQDKLFDKIVEVVEAGNGSDWVSDPVKFKSLADVYYDELATVGEAIITDKINRVPSHVSTPVKFKLTPEEVARLNKDGSIVINLFDRGVLEPGMEDARLLDFGAEQVMAHTDGHPGTANLWLAFEHSGRSIIRSGDIILAFTHSNSRDPTAAGISWGTYYDVVGQGAPQQETVNPTEIALLNEVLAPGSAAPLDQSALYVHPGVWADLTISKRTAPADVNIVIDDLQLFANYTFRRIPNNRAILDVEVAGDVSPTISVDRRDLGNMADGVGSFSRAYTVGAQVTLVAEPAVGDIGFQGWYDSSGLMAATPTVSVQMTSNRRIRATYGAH